MNYKKTSWSVEPVTPDDLTASVEMIIESLDRHKSNKAKYDASETGLKRFQEETEQYFRHILKVNADKPEESHNLIPSVEAWCLYVGISRVTLMKYRQRGGEWEEYIERIKNGIISVKLQLTSTGKLPAIIYMFDACNNGNAYYNTGEYKLPQQREYTESKQLSNSEIMKQIGINGEEVDQK